VRLNTWRYQLTRDPQDALRQRLRELAAVRVRFGYRRLTVLLKREGWRVNAKRIYRLYGLEGLEVRTKPRTREPSARPLAAAVATQRALEHGLRERALGERSLVSDTDRPGSLHARIGGARR
jgi:transposase InsO family protein